MKKILAVAFMCVSFSGWSLAATSCKTPILPHVDETEIEREFQNIYQCISSPNYTSITASSATFTSLSISTITASSATFTNARITNLLGTTTNDSAAVGMVGEYIEGLPTIVDFPTSTQFGDLSSINLTAGDWDVTALAQAVVNGANITNWFIGISQATGNDSTGLVNGVNYMDFPLLNQNGSASVPVYRVSLATSKPIYMKYASTYSGGPPRARGRISARRVR